MWVRPAQTYSPSTFTCCAHTKLNRDKMSLIDFYFSLRQEVSCSDSPEVSLPVTAVPSSVGPTSRLWRSSSASTPETERDREGPSQHPHHYCHTTSVSLRTDWEEGEVTYVHLIYMQLNACNWKSVNLYESSQVSQFRLWSHRQVKDQGDVDGSHRHHVDNVQRVMEELLPVRCEQQPRHHLTERRNTQLLVSNVSFHWYLCTLHQFTSIAVCFYVLTSKVNQQVQNTSRACMVGSSISFPSLSKVWGRGGGLVFVILTLLTFSTILLNDQKLSSQPAFTRLGWLNSDHTEQTHSYIICISQWAGQTSRILPATFKLDKYGRLL